MPRSKFRVQERVRKEVSWALEGIWPDRITTWLDWPPIFSKRIVSRFKGSGLSFVAKGHFRDGVCGIGLPQHPF